MKDQVQSREGMRVLTVRQPWAWLIVHGHKDVENRDWPTGVRGPVLIHAAKAMTAEEYENALDLVQARFPSLLAELPSKLDGGLQFGGIVGQVDIVDCVSRSESPWFFGRWGFVLERAQVLPFVPCRGALGFWRFGG